MGRKDTVRHKKIKLPVGERKNGQGGAGSVASGLDLKAAVADSLLLSVPDLCKLLCISRSTLVRMEKAQSVPGRVMIGGSVRYHRATIEAWLNDQAGA